MPCFYIILCSSLYFETYMSGFYFQLYNEKFMIQNTCTISKIISEEKSFHTRN